MGDPGYVSILIHPACPGQVWLETTSERPALRPGAQGHEFEVYYYAGVADAGAATRYLAAELSSIPEGEIDPPTVRHLLAQLEPQSHRWRPWVLRSTWFWRGLRRFGLMAGITLVLLAGLRWGGGIAGRGPGAAVQAASPLSSR